MWRVERNKTEGLRLTHSDDTLCHFGILGMKWGIRRYQNKDGSLTAAGKKRYQDEASLLDEMDYIEEHGQRGPAPKMSERNKDGARNVLDYYNSDILSYENYDSDRGRKAATLGLKAMDKMGEVDLQGYSPESKIAQDAFLFDDWSLGRAEVADMILRGKSADETKKAVRDIGDAAFMLKIGTETDDWRKYSSLYDIVNEGPDYYNEFIDTCYDIYKKDQQGKK